MSAFTVSGPGLDVRYHDEGPALSRAINAAEHAPAEATFYVRDEAGHVVAQAERRSGVVFVSRPWQVQR